MSIRLTKAVLRLWACIVPARKRKDWLDEWNAEVEGFAHEHRQGGHVKLIRRASLAVADAVMVRRLAAHQGNVDATQSDRGQTMFFATLRDDVRYSVRTLYRSPAFAAAALITIALGVGANTAVFSVVDGILLRSLDYPEPDQLVAIWPAQWFSPREVRRLQEELTSYQSFAAYSQDGKTFSDSDGRATYVMGPLVSADFFDTLGRVPAIGRSFSDGEDETGANDVVVISHDWWQEQFASDSSVVGTTVTLNENTHTIVGVMPPELDFLQKDARYAVPLALTPGSPSFDGRWLQLIGRLRPDVEATQAAEELGAVVARWKEQFRYEENYGSDISVASLRDALVGPVQASLLLLFGAVGLTLLVAVINVTNLLLARAITRQREFTLRIALGARPARLVRQLLTEGMVLSIFGGVLALLVAWWGVHAIVTLLPSNTPRLDGIAVDMRVLMFAGVVAISTGLLVSLVPALQYVASSAGESLGTGSRGTENRKRQRLRSALVVGEVTFSVILLVGSGLLLRSLWGLNQREIGLDANNLIAFTVVPPRSINTDPVALDVYYENLLANVEALPSIEAADAIHVKPVSNGGWVMGITTDPADGEQTDGFQGAWWRPVTAGYIRTVGMRVVAGRSFDTTDDATTARVAVVNETMAREVWPGQDPIGKRFNIGFEGVDGWITVVGVTANVKHLGVTEATPATVYRPYNQTSTALSQRNILQRTILAKTRIQPEIAAAEIGRATSTIVANTPFVDLRPMREVVRESLAEPRALTLLLTIFAAVTLTLGAVGVYGLVAYSVSQRMPEIGIRMALGAKAADILRQVLWQGIKLAAIGVFIGVGIAFGLSQAYASVLHDVSARDPLIFIVVPTLLLVVAAITSYIPALKAGRADPATALKVD